MTLDDLMPLVTGRTDDLFAADVAARHDEITARLAGRRVLVVGGAGSIGAATVRALATYSPRSLHVVDISENNLAELVRDLRSRTEALRVPDFRALPLDFGAPVTHRLLRDSPPYDFVLNFAALKHVRSEKDLWSLLQMLDTNLVKSARFLRWLVETRIPPRYFCVSTDKAANPVNLMGASKRIMEHLIFSGEIVARDRIHATSARFANVAFSDGSLLDSFLRRLHKRQPLAVPRDTRRYFVSPREAGWICLLAAVCGPSRHLLVPRLEGGGPELIELRAVAEAVLHHYGFDPRLYDDEDEAKRRLPDDVRAGRYPLLLTPLDTSGEKPYEEFVGEGETVVEIGMSTLLGVACRPVPAGRVARFLEAMEALISTSEGEVRKSDLVREMAVVVPELRHVETGKSLDDRM